MMKQLLIINRERLLYTSKFVAKDNYAYLGGVFFNYGTIAATDGHYLVEFKNSFKQFDSATGEHETYNLKITKDITRFLKNSKSETIELVEDSTLLYLKDGANLQFIEVIPNPYPDYEKVIPMNNNGNLQGSFRLDAERLATFNYGKKDSLEITTGLDTYTPIIVKSKNAGEDMTGVLMLMRN